MLTMHWSHDAQGRLTATWMETECRAAAPVSPCEMAAGPAPHGRRVVTPLISALMAVTHLALHSAKGGAA